MTEFEIFAKAIQLSGDARQSFLESACGSKSELQERICGLIRAHEESGGLVPRHGHRDTDQTVWPKTSQNPDR